MRTKVMLLALALAVVLAVPGFAANSLTVTNAAAQNGTTFGLQVNLDGSSNNVFVQDDSPVDETVYRYTFWIHPGTLSLQGNTSIRIGAAGMLDPNVGQHIVHFLRYGTGCDCWNLNTWTKEDGGFYQFFTSGIFVAFANNPISRQFQVEFSAGTGSDGVLRITRLGTPEVVREVTTRDTDATEVDNIRWGALAGSGANAISGAYYFDEFVSTR